MLLLNQQLAQVSFQQRAFDFGISDLPRLGFFGLGVSHVDFNQDGFDDVTIGTSQGAPITRAWIKSSQINSTKMTTQVILQM